MVSIMTKYKIEKSLKKYIKLKIIVLEFEVWNLEFSFFNYCEVKIGGRVF